MLVAAAVFGALGCAKASPEVVAPAAVGSAARRFVIPASQLVAVAPEGVLATDVVALGRAAAPVTLYARFPLPRVGASALLDAYLLLAPNEASLGAPSFEVVPLASWNARAFRWRHPPTAEGPALVTTVPVFAPPAQVRLAVRPLVERSLRRGDAELAVAIHAALGDAHALGAQVTLAPTAALAGLADSDATQQSPLAAGPRLDVYLR